jgi:hypothetical protein
VDGRSAAHNRTAGEREGRRRSQLIAAAVAILLGIPPSATGRTQRTANLGVRVTVVRSCAIQTEGGAFPSATVTCSGREPAPPVTTTILQSTARPEDTSRPATPRSTAVVDERPAAQVTRPVPAAGIEDAPLETPVAQARIITINF